MERLTPKCDNCEGLEFNVVEEPDIVTPISAEEYFAKLKAGTLAEGEPSNIMVCKKCGLQYPC